MKRCLLATLVLLCPATVFAGSISGIVSSAKDGLKDKQKAVVIWVEGLAADSVPDEKATVSQTGLQFHPRVITVVAGQTIDFPNDDDVAHNVFSLSKAKQFKLGIYPKGQSRSVKFDKPGVIDLFCSIHRHMHAVVVVTPSAHSATAEIGKPFRIEDVPAGEYVVKVWNSAHKTTSHKIVVTETGDAAFDVTLSK